MAREIVLKWPRPSYFMQYCSVYAPLAYYSTHSDHDRRSCGISSERYGSTLHGYTSYYGATSIWWHKTLFWSSPAPRILCNIAVYIPCSKLTIAPTQTMIEGHVTYHLNGMGLPYMAMPRIMRPHQFDGTGNRFEVAPPLVFHAILQCICPVSLL